MWCRGEIPITVMWCDDDRNCEWQIKRITQPVLKQCLLPSVSSPPSFHFPHSSPAQECDEFTDLDLSHAIIGTNINVRLLLYTRENVSCGALMSHTDPSAHPQFSSSRPTTFVIHGYRPSGSPPNWLHGIIEQLLARKDMNLIIVDWNYGAANVNYFKSVENTHKAANNLTAFIKKMQVRLGQPLWHPLRCDA